MTQQWDIVLRRLEQPITVQERLAILRQFVESWHNPFRLDDGYPEDELQDRPLPHPLWWWYRLAGRRIDLFPENLLFVPSVIEVAEGGLVLFYGDRQLQVWATLKQGDDPPVWSRFHNGPWFDHGTSLSEFLIQTCIEGAVRTAPYVGHGEIGSTMMDQISVLLPLLPLKTCCWPGQNYRKQFHAGYDILLVAEKVDCQREETKYKVFSGAKTNHSLDPLRCIMYGKWKGTICPPPTIEEGSFVSDQRKVLDIARVIRDEGHFQDLPVLADALEEAGCNDSDILAHCRNPVPHAQGCYVLDALVEIISQRLTREQNKGVRNRNTQSSRLV